MTASSTRSGSPSCVTDWKFSGGYWLRRLVWINLDDNECHYLKCCCDEVFGRQILSQTLYGRKSTRWPMTPNGSADNHDHILSTPKTKSYGGHIDWVAVQRWMGVTATPTIIPKERGSLRRSTRSERAPRRSRAVHISVQKWSLRLDPRGTLAEISRPSKLRARWTDNNEIWFGVDGNSDAVIEDVPSGLEDAGPCPDHLASYRGRQQPRSAKTGSKSFQPEQTPFATPKPEKLIKRST